MDQSVLRFEEKHLLDIPAVLTFIDGGFSKSLTRNYTFSVSGEFNVKSSKPMFFLSNDKSRNLILNLLIDMDFKKYNQLTKRPKDIKNLLIKDYYLPGKTIYSPLEVNLLIQLL